MEQDKEARKKRNRSKIIEWALGGLVVLVFLFVVAVNFFLDSIIKNRVITGVRNATGGLYVLEIGDLKSRFFSGAISMKDVWLRPDLEVLKEMRKKDSSAYIPNVNLHLDSVGISSIKWISYLLNNEKLVIGKVLIAKPDFIISARIDQSKGIKENSGNFLDYLPGIIAAFTGSLRIDAIEVVQGNMQFDLYGKGGVVHQLADTIHLDVRKIVIDTVSARKALYSESAVIDIRNYSLTSPNNLNSLRIKRVFGKVEDSILTIDDVSYYQRDSVKSRYRNTIKTHVREIFARGVDYRHLLQEQKIALRTMKFVKPDVELHSSGRAADKQAVKISDTTVLNELVPYISESFQLDTFSVENGAVRYVLQNPKTDIRQAADHIYLDFARVKLDTSSKNSKVYVEDVNLKLRNYTFIKDSTLQLKVASLRASVEDSILHLENIEIASSQSDTFRIHTPSLQGKGFDYIQMLKNKKAVLRELSIESPDILISTHSKADTSAKKDHHSDPRKSFQKVFGPLADAGLNIGVVKISRGRIRYLAKTHSALIEQSASDLEIAVYNVHVDSTSARKKEFYGQFEWAMKDYHLLVHNENFRVNIKEVLADSRNSRLFMNNIGITQIRSFGPHQRYYFTNDIRDAEAAGIDYERFFLLQEVHAPVLTVNELNLKIFLDEGKVVYPDYASTMPQDLMRKLPFYLRVDTIRVNNSSVAYLDQTPALEEPGRLTFEKFQLLAYNFTNDSTLMTDATPAIMEGKAYVMGEGLLKFRIVIPLLSKTFDAYYSGSIDTMSGKAFNSLLAFADMRIEKGVIHPGEFAVEINHGSAIGRLRFEYDNLKVKVLDPKSRKVSKLKSTVGNFMVKDSNPKDDGDYPEIVPLCGRLASDDSFFYFMWRVLREGIITTVTKDSIYRTLVKQ